MFRSSIILLGLLLVAACNPALQSMATVTPTSRFATVAGPLTQRTLPPTWTASPTATVSPTPTATPTTTPSPTPSEANICAGFELLHEMSERYVYAWDDYMPIVVMLNHPGATIRFQATHRQSGEGTGFEMPGGQAIGAEFYMNALPTAGTYDWTLSAYTETYGDSCVITGSFIALRPTTPTPTLLPPTETPTKSTN